MSENTSSARLTCEIQACLADIISSDAAGIVAEYNSRDSMEKLICALGTASGASKYNNHTNSIHFLTDGFPNGRITRFMLQMRGDWASLEDKHYSILIAGPDGEICTSVRFNDLCINSSFWVRRSQCLLQTAGHEYRKQMLALMSRY